MIKENIQKLISKINREYSEFISTLSEENIMNAYRTVMKMESSLSDSVRYLTEKEAKAYEFIWKDNINKFVTDELGSTFFLSEGQAKVLCSLDNALNDLYETFICYEDCSTYDSLRAVIEGRATSLLTDVKTGK